MTLRTWYVDCDGWIASRQAHANSSPSFQGFASGSPETDAAGIRLFVNAGIPLFVCQSYSKNFGLYNERVGNVVVVGPDADSTAATVSQLKILVRANWSNPPAFGARVVAITLGDPALRQEWFECLKLMSGRVQAMRQKLKAALIELGTPGTWDHITNQIGMFSFTGLTGLLLFNGPQVPRCKSHSYSELCSGTSGVHQQKVPHLHAVEWTGQYVRFDRAYSAIFRQGH